MSERPLEIRRGSVPGFARSRDREAAAEPTAQLAEAPPAPPAAPAPRRARKPKSTTAATTTTTPAPATSSSYAGAGSVQFNVRLLTPLHERYARLVRQLADEGFKTTSTELVHALMHEGPETPADARELVRRWRRERADD